MKMNTRPHGLRNVAGFKPSRLLTNTNLDEENGGKNMSRYLTGVLISLILLSGITVSAQSTTATIAGVVQDASGAVIPGVSITAKNVETGLTRTATSDEGGRYTIPELTLGDYEMEAQLPGFQTEVRTGITLMVGSSAVVNFSLKVGQISDRVTI